MLLRPNPEGMKTVAFSSFTLSITLGKWDKDILRQHDWHPDHCLALFYIQ